MSQGEVYHWLTRWELAPWWSTPEDEFGMNSPAIPQAKAVIRNWNTHQAALLAAQVLRCEAPGEVEILVASGPPA